MDAMQAAVLKRPCRQRNPRYFPMACRAALKSFKQAFGGSQDATENKFPV